MAESITPCSYWSEAAALQTSEHSWPYIWKLIPASNTVPVPPPYDLCVSEVLKKMYRCCREDLLWQGDARTFSSCWLLQLTRVQTNLQRRERQDHGRDAPSPMGWSASQSASSPLPAQSSCPLSPDGDSMIPTCKHESLRGTLCSPENFIRCRMKLLWHPSPSIADGEANVGWNLSAIPPCWSPLGRHCWVPRDSTVLWPVDGVSLTWVCKRHVGREMTYWKIQVDTKVMIFTAGSLAASLSKALDLFRFIYSDLFRLFPI